MRPSFKLSKINLDDVNDRLSYKEVEIGEETRRAISEFSLEQQRKFELGAVSFQVTSTKHLVKRLPLGNVILGKVRGLKPGALKESWTLKGIKILLRRLNTGEDIDRLQINGGFINRRLSTRIGISTVTWILRSMSELTITGEKSKASRTAWEKRNSPLS